MRRVILNNTLVGNISSYDFGEGVAEILSYDSEGILVKFIVFTPCYKCQVYSKKIYTKPMYFGWDEVFTLTLEKWAETKVLFERLKSIKYDKPIFRRYKS